MTLEIKGQERLPVGVVVERRDIDNRWIQNSWKPVAVIAGAAASDPRESWTGQPIRSDPDLALVSSR